MRAEFFGARLRVERGMTVTYVLLIAANVAAWAWAFVAFSDRPALMGTALLAYVFGLRHAFDADHIAAIDNVVRKLMQDGQPARSVGLYFSMGHSTIVIIASVLLAVSAAALQGSLERFHAIGGVIGTSVSALFLLAIGLLNFLILRDVWKAFVRARRGEKISEADMDAVLAGRGFLARLFRPMFRMVTRAWHMYPVGFLFALGFDTATEIGLLGISAAQAGQGMSLWNILVFPALFTAGMSLMDTTDSVMMSKAYGWAFVNPVRKLWYNLTITFASVVVAIFIGGVEALGLIGNKLGLSEGFWGVIGSLNDNLTSFGFIVVGIFALSWLGSMLAYRVMGLEKAPSVAR
jgi:nickel/cobalt transporter (NiCoT) family protein